MKVVHDISQFNLADVPARLRGLADEIEASGQSVHACVVVIDIEQVGVDIRGYGRGADNVRSLGLLQMGTYVMASALADFGIDTGSPPPAA